MYVLKDRKCERCDNYIQVHSYRDKDRIGRDIRVVDYGSCVCCGKLDILPIEEYSKFVHQFCIRI